MDRLCREPALSVTGARAGVLTGNAPTRYVLHFSYKTYVDGSSLQCRRHPGFVGFLKRHDFAFSKFELDVAREYLRAVDCVDDPLQELIQLGHQAARAIRAGVVIVQSAFLSLEVRRPREQITGGRARELWDVCPSEFAGIRERGRYARHLADKGVHP